MTGNWSSQSQMETCESSLSASGLWESRFSLPALSVVFQTIHLQRTEESFLCIYLDMYLLLESEMPFVTQEIKCTKALSKRGSATFFSSSHPLICAYLPRRPGDMLFPLKVWLQIGCSQTFCVDKIYTRLYSDWVSPSSSHIAVLTGADISQGTQFSWSHPILSRRSQSAEGKLIQKHFLFMTFLKVTVKSRKRKKQTKNKEGKKSCSARLFSFPDPGNDRVTRQYSQTVLLHVFMCRSLTLSQTIWFKMFRGRGAALQICGDLQCLICWLLCVPLYKSKRKWGNLTFFVLLWVFWPAQLDSLLLLSSVNH